MLWLQAGLSAGEDASEVRVCLWGGQGGPGGGVLCVCGPAIALRPLRCAARQVDSDSSWSDSENDSSDDDEEDREAAVPRAAAAWTGKVRSGPVLLRFYELCAAAVWACTCVQVEVYTHKGLRSAWEAATADERRRLVAGLEKGSVKYAVERPTRWNPSSRALLRRIDPDDDEVMTGDGAAGAAAPTRHRWHPQRPRPRRLGRTAAQRDPPPDARAV